MYKLLHGDCLDKMKEMADGSIDLTVTSPPYDNLRTYNGNIDQWNFKKFQDIADELYRITRNGGVVVWVVGDATIDGSETGTSFKQALYFKEIGFNIHDTMIWEKPNPMPRDTRIPRYWQAFEYMFILSKGKPDHFTFLREPCKLAGKRSSICALNPDGTRRLDRKEKTKNHVVNDDKPRGNVWEVNPATSKADRNGHPAAFPEQLALDHILSWSHDGDVVFDPFMGSGTTGKMAILNNLDFIGTEIDEEYFNIAKNRIESAANNEG